MVRIGQFKLQAILLVGVLAIVAGSPAAAQDDEPATDPTTDPLLNNPSTIQAESDLERPPARPVQVDPERRRLARPMESALPGVHAPGFRPDPGQLVREGAFLRSRRGRLISLRSGGWAFVFDPDANGRSEPPMILQPCLTLAQMIQIDAARTQMVTFRIDGEVFVYRGRNYLLPSYFTTIAAPAPPAVGDPVLEDPDAPAIDPDNPSVEELIGEVESRARTNEPPEPARDETLRTSHLLREGTMIVLKRGRIESGPSGGWAFRPENDADSPAQADMPLLLMPSQNLERLEQFVLEYGHGRMVSITGEVFTFDEENYLLPSMFLIERNVRENLTSAQ